LKRGIYIAFDQLNKNFGALAQADPANDVIILVESQRMLQSRTWHIQRLWFMISAAKHSRWNFGSKERAKTRENHWLRTKFISINREH
jgi:deoxyribodipyrimidine photolyase-like uncharacterized protein